MKNLNTYNLYQITRANDTTISSKRLYKTTLKILCTKITTIVRLLDVNIIWVLKYGT